MSLMRESQVAILVLAKYGAVEESKAICNGCKYGRRRLCQQGEGDSG